MILDQATPDDAEQIIELLWQRPAEGVESFTYAPQGWWVVCRDEQDIVGFMIVRWKDEENALIVDRIEVEYFLGRPTERGRQAYDMLASEVYERADKASVDILAPVNVGNRTSIMNLLRAGFTKEVVTLRRKPVVRPKAETMREETAC